MNTLVIVGAQWGDEGKGKMIDFLSERADMVVRYQGGNNAGHSVEVGNEQYKLHLIPSGILYEDKANIIANGVVLDPEVLLKEIEGLNSRGIKTDSLVISDRCHVIMPYHKRLDELMEAKLGQMEIGTTKKGIGPCYMDKAERVGIRVCDLIDEKVFEQKARALIQDKNKLIKEIYGGEPLDEEDIIANYLGFSRKIKPFVKDTVSLLHESLDNSKILFEGAQGTLLDTDLGTYPYVTSSHPTSGGVAIGTGVGPTYLNRILGITKAYLTRVGKGPFPTELLNDTGDKLRDIGKEYGTTTGRARRCGWLDMVALRYARFVNGLTDLAITKLDVLSGFEEIKLCVGYELDGTRITHMPARLEDFERCVPIYESFKGFSQDITEAKTYDELPIEAKIYLKRIEELSGVRISIVAIGPRRDQTIVVNELFA